MTDADLKKHGLKLQRELADCERELAKHVQRISRADGDLYLHKQTSPRSSDRDDQEPWLIRREELEINLASARGLMQPVDRRCALLRQLVAGIDQYFADLEQREQIIKWRDQAGQLPGGDQLIWHKYQPQLQRLNNSIPKLRSNITRYLS